MAKLAGNSNCWFPYSVFFDSSTAMKKKTEKPTLLVELINRKMAAQKSGAAPESFGKFKPSKERNKNTSAVGPAWGGRKGN